MRKALLLPATFAVVVVPLAIFVISGAGTHMSPMLLYLPAAPWWLIYPGETFASEAGALLVGCAINAFLLYVVGAAIDRRGKKRRPVQHGP
jgi:hypothetical protein